MRPRTAQNLRGPACSLCDIIHFGYFHQINLLVSKGIHVNARDAFGRTPLILCAFMQPEDWGVGTAMTLIEHGVYLGERDCFGRNVLHYACIYERQKLVPVLLRAIDFDLNQADTLGNTALHYAAMSGNVSITNLLVQSYKKYRLKANKVNRQGKTAIEEALTCGNTACAGVIEEELAQDQQESTTKDVHFRYRADIGSLTDNVTSQSLPVLGTNKFRRSTSAAILNRRESSSSNNSSHKGRLLISSVGRLNNTKSGYTRKSSNPLYSKGYRRDEEIITCAPIRDFRNTPEYVCKLARLPYDSNCWSHVTAKEDNPWEDTSIICQRQHNGSDWRRELERLFKVYEHQCSASWRTSRQLDQSEAAAPTSSAGTEDDDKGKKGRSCSSVAKGQQWKDSPEPKKRVSSVRSRRLPNGKHVGGATADGSLDTSTESINSFTSIKRKGLEKESSLGRSGPSSPLPTVTASKKNPSTGDTAPQLVNTKGNMALPISSFTNEASMNLSAPNDATLPSPVPAQMLTGEGISSALRSGSNQLMSSNSTHKDDATVPLPKITVVKEVVPTEDTQTSSSNSQQYVDTNKLWVQNPYESNNNEADDETVTSD
ncbi:unnamed protein product [Candidula unifasciata]|uniref:Uncharacterized protein n=1 Tax=Candidula unifasciata TaxID=100452 RepID=A0A8S3YLW2_9EUPU|nr:unnamed protein product [Candidula unifasciata]